MKPRRSGRAALGHATAQYRDGDYEEALLTLAGSETEDVDYVDVAYLIGLCHVRMGRYDDALQYLEQVVTSGIEDSRTDQCRLTLAYIYSITGRMKLAEYELKRLMEHGRSDPAIFATMAYASFAQGRTDESLVFYEAALEKEPENPTAMNGVGYVLSCKDTDLPRALELCRGVVEKHPRNPAYLDSLGWTCFRLGLFAEARKFLVEASTLLPGNPVIAGHLAELERRLSRGAAPGAGKGKA